MDESYTFKKYLLGLVEHTENHDIFYFKPGTIFINCYFPGNFVIEINKEYPMEGATKFIASLIDAKAARNYRTKRGKQVESRLKSILEQWKKDEFYDRDKM